MNNTKTKEGGFNCNICDKTISNKCNFKKHITNKHDHDRQFDCQLCNLSYKSLAALAHHKKKIHTVENVIYKCDLCEKNFYVKEFLKTHIKLMHEASNDMRKFMCDLCDTLPPYATKSHLERHIKTVHEGLRFSCKICDKKFTG